MITRLQQRGQLVFIFFLALVGAVHGIWQAQLVAGDAIVIEGVGHFHLR